METQLKKEKIIENHWLVKAKGFGLNNLIGSIPNGTQADFWSWYERQKLDDPKNGPKYIITRAVFYGSRNTAANVMNSPNIVSVEMCTDPELCYEYVPFEIKD